MTPSIKLSGLLLLTLISVAHPTVTLAASGQSAALTPTASGGQLADAMQRQDFDAARMLLTEGAIDVNAAQADGATAIAWAAHWDALDIASRLVQAGADVKAANELGVTPLMLAANNGSQSMVEMLLEAGADPNVTRPSGDSPLMMAARVGNPDVVLVLTRAGANPNRTTNGGHTALMWAAAEGHADVAKTLIDQGAGLVDVRTKFERPAQRMGYGGTRELVLLREGEAANPAEFPRDGDGDPPRTQGGFTPLLYAVLGGHMETVRILVDAGVDVDEASPDGVSALMLALTKRYEELALYLIESGANPNFDTRGDLLQSNAHLADGQDPLVVESSDVATDYTGYSALHLAAATGQHAAMRELLARGADPNARMDRPKRFTTAFEIGVFASPGAGRLTQLGSTPFIVAAKAADAEGMRILADGGADPFLTTADGSTALALAAGLGKRAASDITYYEWNQQNAIEAARVALDLGLDINAGNEWGETALHGATYHAADELIRFLVESGADLNATNWENQTPLRLAKGHMLCCTTYVEHPHIAELFLELGSDPTTGKQVTFGLLGYHSDDKDGGSDSDAAGDTSGDPR